MRRVSIKAVKRLVLQGESEQQEFKKSTTQLKPVFETICAFLNGHGGTVFIGVTQDGKIIGQNVTDNTQLEIANMIRKLEPFAQVAVDYFLVDKKKSKKIIVINVPKGTHAPYTYDGRAYERSQSSTVRMLQHRYEQLLIERAQLNYSWEDMIAPGYFIDDLDEDLILKVVHDSITANRLPATTLKKDTQSILEQFKLYNHGKLTNAAMILFGQDLLEKFPQCQLKMARFKGIDRREFLDSSIIYGNIFRLLEEGMLFIQCHISISAKIIPGKLQRVGQP